MFNPYKKQNDVLEKFRIKAHLRSDVKDPVVIDKTLLQDAVERLKKLPYKHKDPTDAIAIELVRDAYRSGFFGLRRSNRYRLQTGKTKQTPSPPATPE